MPRSRTRSRRTSAARRSGASASTSRGPEVRHEEVGAVLLAKLTTQGGSYSPTNARYDYLTLNHFADMSGSDGTGVTLSNADAYFMRIGNSTVQTLDTATPQLSVLAGGSLRPSNPIVNQAGDSYFLQRFALQSHGPYDQPRAMRFALEHQNPLVGGMVSGGTAYPASSYSYLSISDPNVLLWSLKPAEEGIGEGVIARRLEPHGEPEVVLALPQRANRAREVGDAHRDRSRRRNRLGGNGHRDRSAESASVLPALPVVARPFGEAPADRLANDRGRRRRLIHGRSHRRSLAAAQRSVHGRRCRDAWVRLRSAFGDGDDSGRSQLGGDHAEAARRLGGRIPGDDHGHAHRSARATCSRSGGARPL